MKASEWNNPESIKSSDNVWIAVKTETGVHVDEGYAYKSEWCFSTGEPVRFSGVVIGWLPKAAFTWEPDDE